MLCKLLDVFFLQNVACFNSVFVGDSLFQGDIWNGQRGKYDGFIRYVDNPKVTIFHIVAW